jgi:PAS domain S-box-containing protein
MTQYVPLRDPPQSGSVGAAAEAIMRTRGRERVTKRLFDRSPVPMVMVDGGRRYVDANPPARLAFRLSLDELRGYTVDDLTPPEERPEMEATWAALLDTGWVSRRRQVVSPDGCRLDIVVWALRDALPGLHLGAFALARWPEDELSKLDHGAAHPPLAPLTPREEEVLQLAAEGLSGPAIAARLFVSSGTVKTHFQNIYDKLKVRDRAAAVARGLRIGFID